MAEWAEIVNTGCIIICPKCELPLEREAPRSSLPVGLEYKCHCGYIKLKRTIDHVGSGCLRIEINGR